MKIASIIPKGFFKANQTKLFDLIEKKIIPKRGDIVLLKGPISVPNFDDDALNFTFPENLYYYLTGIYSDIDTFAVLNLFERKVIIFSPKYDLVQNFWQKLKSPEDYIKEFEIDGAQFVTQLPDYLKEKVAKDTNFIYLYSGVNPYSKNRTLDAHEDFKTLLQEYKVDKTSFYELACECRVIKSSTEIKLISESANLAVNIHKLIMKSIKIGTTEKSVANAFYSISKQYGATKAYECIVCAGENGSFLHYSPSSKSVFKDGELILIDSGCRLNNYCSDITRTYPVNGKFTQKQSDIYRMVLNAQIDALDMIRPGVSWIDVHIQAEKSLLKGLIEKGLVKGSVEEAWNKRVIYYFMPHGIGHYIGLYTHDLPGLKSEEEKPIPPKTNLRVRRILEEGMVLTCEPGLYFNQTLLKSGFDDPSISGFFNKDLILLYAKEVGGIRIEDMLVVLKDKCDVITKELPKTIEEIEAFMRK